MASPSPVVGGNGASELVSDEKELSDDLISPMLRKIGETPPDFILDKR